jgi:trimeric autotransporter adhesin
MSTKTTFKRIALVAVAAMGFGVLTSVAPANALPTGSISLNATSFTVIGAGGSTNYAVAEVTLRDTAAAAAVLDAGETLTARVISNTPATGVAANAVANSDVELATAAGVSDSNGAASSLSSWGPAATAAAALEVATTSTTGVDMSLRRTGTIAATPVANTYFFAMRAASNKTDLGTYTIRVSVLNAAGNQIASQDLTFTPVASALDARGTLSFTSAGLQTTGQALGLTSTSNLRVILADANNGRIRSGANGQPNVSVTGVDSSATPASAGTFTAFDDASADEMATAGSLKVALNGNYGVKNTGLTGIAGTVTVTARFGSLSGTGSFTMAAAAANHAFTSVAATGGVVDTGNYTLPLTTKSVTNTITVVNNATLSLGTAVTGQTMYYTVSYGAGCVVGDMKPAGTTSAAPTRVVTDANGQASFTLTNANPIEGATACVATVTWSGASAGTAPAGYVTRTFTWKKPVATTVAASVGSYSALLASTNEVTWTVLDQFGAPMAGETVVVAHTGANAPLAGVPSMTSNASGQVSYKYTDAKGVVDSTTLGADTVRVATVGLTTISATTGNNVVVTYRTTLPVAAKIKAEYGTTIDSQTILVPATAIGGVAGKAISANDRWNTSKAVSCADPGCVAIKFSPLTSADLAVSGVPFTVTVDGGFILDSADRLVTSRTLYSATALWVTATKTGTVTVTATIGAITSKATINFVNAAADARVITATESKGTVTGKVTDAFGNAVAGVDVNVNITGAKLSSGSSFATFKTALDGSVVFDVQGAGTATVSLQTAAKSGNLAGYGDAIGVIETPGAPEGVAVASVKTDGVVNAAAIAAAAEKAAADAKAAADKASTDAAIAALKAQLDAAAAKAAADKASSDAAIAAAQAAAVEAATAATDAATEALDAANAATDAANASAEAADAATAAAQDSADAVAALSTQVSEMISALKKQITALTNLVIKIQRKVRA